VGHIEQMKNEYKYFVEKPEGKIPFGGT